MMIIRLSKRTSDATVSNAIRYTAGRSSEAKLPSYKLLLCAIRRIGSGIYAYLPLMWRVLQKVSQIVREAMNATGAQECLLPQLQPAQLWHEPDRWDTYYPS